MEWVLWDRLINLLEDAVETYEKQLAAALMSEYPNVSGVVGVATKLQQVQNLLEWAHEQADLTFALEEEEEDEAEDEDEGFSDSGD